MGLGAINLNLQSKTKKLVDYYVGRKKNAPVKPNKTRAWYSYESGTAAGWEPVPPAPIPKANIRNRVFGYKYLELSDNVFTFSVANAGPCLDLIGKAKRTIEK